MPTVSYHTLSKPNLFVPENIAFQKVGGALKPYFTAAKRGSYTEIKLFLSPKICGCSSLALAPLPKKTSYTKFQSFASPRKTVKFGKNRLTLYSSRLAFQKEGAIGKNRPTLNASRLPPPKKAQLIMTLFNRFKTWPNHNST